jgi:O-antigen ligase
MITALGFMLLNLISYFLAFKRGPFWGLFAYINIYFNAPTTLLNWWVDYLPFNRWSLLTSAVLVLSLFIHKKELSDHKFVNTKWVYVFFLLSAVIAFTSAIDEDDAYHFLYILFTYCLIIYILIRSIKTEAQLRLFFISIVLLVGHLGLEALLNGKRVNNRLEMIGSGDAYGSNEFSLLLAAIIPLVFVFIKNGKRFERIIALCSLPFILNAFILCNSRGSAAAFVGGVVISVLFIADKQIKKGMVILLIAITPVFLYLTDDAYIERFSTLLGFNSAMEDEAAAQTLSSGRTEIWQYGFQMAEDHPFGVGPNGFKKLARFYMPKEVLTFKNGSSKGVRSAHNTYLQVIVEQGIIGIIIWCLMCFHTCLVLAKAFKLVSKLQNPKPFWKDSIFSLNIAFYSVLIGGFVNSRVYYEFFWWQLAIAAIVYSLATDIAKQDKLETNLNT